jgi:hypothetical protein
MGAFYRFKQVKLRLPQKQLTKLLELKADRLQAANKIFLEIVQMGDPEWAIAGLYRVGQTYQLFSEALFAAPKPKGLTRQEQDLYQIKLEEQAFPVEDKAVEAFEKGLNKAYELGSYGQWAQLIRKELSRYRPNQYPPIEERFPTVTDRGGSFPRDFVGLK